MRSHPTTPTLLALLALLMGCAPPAGELSVSTDDPDNRFLLDFGEVEFGATVELGVHLHNIGDAELRLTDFIFVNSPQAFQFTGLNELVPIMEADTWWTLWVGFTPVGQGEALNEIGIVVADQEEPFLVTLVGQGIVGTD